MWLQFMWFSCGFCCLWSGLLFIKTDEPVFLEDYKGAVCHLGGMKVCLGCAIWNKMTTFDSNLVLAFVFLLNCVKKDFKNIKSGLTQDKRKLNAKKCTKPNCYHCRTHQKHQNPSVRYELSLVRIYIVWPNVWKCQLRPLLLFTFPKQENEENSLY